MTVSFLFWLSLAVIIWNFFQVQHVSPSSLPHSACLSQALFVSAFLRMLTWPFIFIHWLLTFLPPFEETPGLS